MNELWGEKGYTTIEKLGARPSLDVNGMWGGFQGEGVKTVIPSQAHAKITCRLVPRQDPEDIAEKIGQHLRKVCPEEISITVKRGNGARPWLCDPDHLAIKTGVQALEEAFKTKAYLTRLGGSIPVVEQLYTIWKLPIVLMGFGLPHDNVHAPNEKFSLDVMEKGTLAIVSYWNRLQLDK